MPVDIRSAKKLLCRKYVLKPYDKNYATRSQIVDIMFLVKQSIKYLKQKNILISMFSDPYLRAPFRKKIAVV